MSVDNQLGSTLENLIGLARSKFDEALALLLKSSSKVFFRNSVSDSIGQKALASQWRLLHLQGFIFSDFNEVGFRNYSQNNEDGILLYIFTIIGTDNKIFVEIGANCDDSHVGIPENNSTNLVVNFGWNGLIVEGSKNNTGQLIHFFASSKDTKHFHWKNRRSKQEWESNYYCPIIRHAVATKDNVNDLIKSASISGNIDMLSIDIDGADYWLWDSIDVISPRVVVIEFNNKMKMQQVQVNEYKDGSMSEKYTDDEWIGVGSSLSALIHLGRKKDYRLIGVNSTSFNAFFMRNDVGMNEFREVCVEDVEKLPIFKIVSTADRIVIDKTAE